jgi:hypothetical protein
MGEPTDSLLIFVLWLAQKSGEVALSKLLDKLLSEQNLKRLKSFFKIQILVLYLNWVLLKTQLKSLPINQANKSVQQTEKLH